MILSSLNAAACPYSYPEAIQKALDWLKSNDLEHMETGTYEIQGKDIYALVQELTTKPVKERRAEKHEVYADIQYIISGKERMGYAPYTGAEEVLEKMEGKDACYFTNLVNENFVDVVPGGYCIFFSNDIHRPGAAAGEAAAVKKVVVKVKEALL